VAQLSTLGAHEASMKNIEIISRETERKIMWLPSIIFMIAAWVFLAAIVVMVLDSVYSDDSPWELWTYLYVCIPSVFLVLIPIQLVRYFRQRP
jgi:membrane protein YdbS with pleckstrin-like domain